MNKNSLSEMESYFYVFRQNNSGGYFIIKPDLGIGETIVIEAFDFRTAWQKLEKIGDTCPGFWQYCSCCGERWYEPWNDEEKIPKDKLDVRYGYQDNKYYIHYLDGTIECRTIEKKQ